MKTTTVKTQAEMDALPASFETYTRIYIESTERIVVRMARGNSSVVAWGNSSVVAWDNSSVVAWGNSSVEAWGNSSVEAWDNSSVVARENSSVVARENSSVVAWGNSSVEAWGNSSVEAWGNSSVGCFLCSSLVVFSTLVTIKSLLDNSRLIYKRAGCKRPEKQDATAIIVEYEQLITPTFDQWLERGYVVADEIHQKLESQKTIGEVTIFEVTDLLGKNPSFVARKGDKFAHGKTIEEAKNDLRYKISDRDTSKYLLWKVDEEKSQEEMIEAYMTITGACSMGTKMFCEEKTLKDKMAVKEVIELTIGRYGHEAFKNFGWAK